MVQCTVCGGKVSVMGDGCCGMVECVCDGVSLWWSVWVECGGVGMWWSMYVCGVCVEKCACGGVCMVEGWGGRPKGVCNLNFGQV